MQKSISRLEVGALCAGFLSAAALVMFMWGSSPGTLFWIVKELFWMVYVNLGVFVLTKRLLRKEYERPSVLLMKFLGAVFSFCRAFALFQVSFVFVVCVVEFFRG